MNQTEPKKRKMKKNIAAKTQKTFTKRANMKKSMKPTSPRITPVTRRAEPVRKSFTT
jgi:hypothetical protein